MRKTFTKIMSALMLAAVAAVLPQQVWAQVDDDDLTIKGYANVWINVKAVPESGEGGTVFPFYQESKVKAWRASWEFKQSIPVIEMVGVNVSVFYLYANPLNGYIFAGWYADNGDGVFNIEEDHLISENAEYVSLATLDDDVQVYETDVIAKNGTFPAAPTETIFAYFTNGARASVSYYQGDGDDLYAHCGTVFIDKEVNNPGDEVTVRALPNDGFQFEYWQDADHLGKIVSRENPYTFTVKGGEHLYAYFKDLSAPEYELPAEGGYKTAVLDDTWVLSDESYLDGARVLVMEQEDLKRTDAGQVYLDQTVEEAQFDVSMWHDTPTIIYGKGKVSFAYKMKYGFMRNRNPLVKWSGNKGVTIASADPVYVYVFVDQLGAFVQYGTTDAYSPKATSSIQVPAGVAYVDINAWDLTDDKGNIPAVIGLSPDTYDAALAQGEAALDVLLGIEGVKRSETTLHGQRIYTLSGLQLKTTPERGVYIVNGRKVVLTK
ncbi:MAG: hypothetical protein IJ588_14000 [Prevotella sp.]|nr:hypothetical protein [Prevotella sp.]